MQNSRLAFDQLMEWALRLLLWRRRRFQTSWWTRTSWCFNHTMFSVGQLYATFNNFLFFWHPNMSNPWSTDLRWPLVSGSILAVCNWGVRNAPLQHHSKCWLLDDWHESRCPCFGVQARALNLWVELKLKICTPGQERLLRSSRIRTLTKSRPGIMEL